MGEAEDKALVVESLRNEIEAFGSSENLLSLFIG